MNESTPIAPVDLAAAHSLPRWRKIALASGDLGMNFYWQSITYFLLFFYTDVLGLPAQVAGLIYMAASIFDGIMDPIAGHFMEGRRSRFGRYRPWIAIGALPLATSFALIYWQPPFEGAALIAFVTVAHMLFRISFTIVAVPIASLIATVTSDSRERSSLTGMRVMFALAGAVIVTTGTRPLASYLGRDEASGFFWVAALSGCAATIIYMIVLLSVHEAPESTSSAQVLHVPLRQRWSSVFSNRAFMALVGGLLGATVAITAVSKSVVYYFKYVVHDEAAGTMALSIITVSSFLSVPIWTIVARRFGTRALWLVGVTIGLAGLVGMAALRPSDQTTASALYVALQSGIVAISLAYWAMLPDTVEYGQWRTGIRLESFLIGLFMFFQKFGLGLAAGLFGWALQWIGFSKDGSESQSVSANLPLVVIALASLGFVGSGLCILASPLRKGVHDRITAELEGRLTGNPVLEEAA